ncbi:MAG TPA: hypothetical protein VFV10_02040 [Gammaproteobacteria bacterium]|nr:hypothetical protein [Gammaproteobacteria bacterium]
MARANEATAAVPESTGVEALIGRLREEGITQGRSQADALVSEAERKAAGIVADARRQAEAVIAQATNDAAKLKAGADDAIRLAMRDTILALEGDMLKAFTERLRGLVKGVLADPAFLERLILEVAGRASKTGERGELLLPPELVSLEDLQKSPEAAKPGTLMHFVLSLGGGVLREGMRFGVAPGGEGGILVRLVDEDVEIDLTDSSITELLLKHMLPRYRALLRGAVAPDGQEPAAADARKDAAGAKPARGAKKK